MNDNWLLVFGIDFDPAPSDPAKIEAAVRAKEEAWRTAERSSSGQKKIYAQYRLEQMKTQRGAVLKGLKDPERRSAYERDARAAVHRAVDEKIGVALQGRECLYEGQIEGIASLSTEALREATGVNDAEVNPAVVRARAKELGYRIEKGDPPEEKAGIDLEKAKRVYGELIATKPANEQKLRQAERYFPTLQVKNLFEFACPDFKGDYSRLRAADLLKGAETQCAKHKTHGPKKTAAESLRATVQNVIKSDADVSAYVKYLQWLELRRILDAARKTAFSVHGGKIAGQYADSVIEELAQVLGDPDTARLLLAGYCEEVEGLSFDQRETRVVYESRVPLSGAQVEGLEKIYPYQGIPVTPEVRVTAYGTVLKEGADYRVSYQDNVQCGTAILKVTGIGKYEGEIVQTYDIKLHLRDCIVELTPESFFSPSDAACVPEVEVTPPAGLTMDGDFGVRYTVADNKGVGVGRVMLEGTGLAYGRVARRFPIYGRARRPQKEKGAQ